MYTVFIERISYTEIKVVLKMFVKKKSCQVDFEKK